MTAGAGLRWKQYPGLQSVIKLREGHHLLFFKSVDYTVQVDIQCQSVFASGSIDKLLNSSILVRTTTSLYM